MLGFRRRPQAGDPATFWAWWHAEGRDAAAQRIHSGDWGDFPAEVARRVAAVHPSLDWSFQPGVTAEHALCVTPGGDGALRAVAGRWLRTAPPPTEDWEFHAAVPRATEALDRVLEIEGRSVDVAAGTVAPLEDEDALRVHLAVHHPSFADLSLERAAEAALLALTALLGEDDVERWIGRVDPVRRDRPDSVPLAELVPLVDAFALRHREPEWVLAEVAAPELVAIVCMLRPVHPADHPTLDLHSAVVLRTPSARRGGPGGYDVQPMYRMQEELTAELGGRGLLLATVQRATSRTLHVRTDAEDQNGRDLLDRFAARHGARAKHVLDPAWSRADSIRSVL